MVDYATRYPEAVAIPRIDTERVAEALLDVLSRVGFPSEILSDRDSQFTSDLMKEVSRLVSMRQLFTTPYNPKCNGLCERINGVLKSMLKKMCQERPKNLDIFLPAVLFAYREVPQASKGFSPFELLYGRTVRGPLQVLKELWTEEETPETQNTYQYLFNLKHRLEETCKIAKKSLSKSSETYKHHYDKKTRKRCLSVGDKVLVLLPTDRNKMLLQWKGPYEVTEKLNEMDYKVRVGGRSATYHINLLKKYEEQESVIAASAAIIEADTGDQIGAVDDENLLDLPKVTSKETYEDVQICETLSAQQKQQVRDILLEFQDIRTERTGTTTLTQHRIDLLDKNPILVKQYPVPYSKRPDVDAEVEDMLQAGVIEQANSEYNSPIVIVKKKDGGNRFCVDYSITNCQILSLGQNGFLLWSDIDVTISKRLLTNQTIYKLCANRCRNTVNDVIDVVNF